MAEILSQDEINNLLDCCEELTNPLEQVRYIISALERSSVSGSVSNPEVVYDFEEVKRFIKYLKNIKKFIMDTIMDTKVEQNDK